MEYVWLLVVICGLCVMFLKWRQYADEKRRKAEETRRIQARNAYLDSLDQARNAYQRSLDLLEITPNNPQLRRQCLAEGREFARLCREDGLETTFDELSIRNDIDAACAASSSGGFVNAELANPIPFPTAEEFIPQPPLKSVEKLPIQKRGLGCSGAFVICIAILIGCPLFFWAIGYFLLNNKDFGNERNTGTDIESASADSFSHVNVEYAAI